MKLKLSIFVILFCLIFNTVNSVNFFNYYGKKIYNNPKILALILGTATVTSSCVIAYKKNEQFKNKVKRATNKVENSFIDNVALPLFIKWEDLKISGPTKKDLIKAAGIGSAATGSFYFANKKWNLINKSKVGASYFWNKLKQISKNTKNNKEIVMGFSGTVLALPIFYKFYKLLKTTDNNQLINSFLIALDLNQRSQISKSEELLKLLDQANKNPAILLQNSDFVAILNSEQKEQLKNMVNLN